MEEIVTSLSITSLIKLVGNDWKDVLDSLVKADVVRSYEAVVHIKFDKSKALHIQSVLEFYDLKEASSKPIKSRKVSE